jgi:hypothetical protein
MPFDLKRNTVMPIGAFFVDFGGYDQLMKTFLDQNDLDRIARRQAERAEKAKASQNVNVNVNIQFTDEY